MTTFGFKFIYALTLIHTLCTLLGMQLFCYVVSCIIYRFRAQDQSGPEMIFPAFIFCFNDHARPKFRGPPKCSKQHCLQGMFEKKVLSKQAIAPLAVAYVGYIVLNNLNLQINTVGFYQISKIAVAPAGALPPCQ